MPVDVSFYNQQPQNALSGLGGTIGIANGIVQNRIANTESQMLQSELGSRQAIGNAFSAAVDPATGSVDPSKVNTGIASNPAAAYGAPGALQSSATLQGAGLSNQAQNVNQSGARFGDLYTSLTPLLSTNKPVQYSDVINTAGDLLRQGRLLPQDFTAFVNEVPRDPKQLTSYVQKKSQSVLPVASQENPAVTGVNSAGQPVTGTAGQLINRATTPTSSSEPPGVTTTLPPGEADKIAANRAGFVNDLQTSSGKIANIRNLTTAIPMLEAIGPGGAGPTSPQWAQARSFLQTNGIIGQNDNDPNVIRDKAQKYLEKYVSTNPIAGRSDQAQGLAAMASPNLDTAMSATVGLAKSAVGFDRMDAALPLIYAKQNPKDQSDYLTGKTTLQNSLDPRAFSLDLLNPTERATLQKSLGSKDSPAYKKFVNSYNLAKEAGMLQPSQGGQ